jgi:asparagine N-glycosylation enzyme membrane subunit Stt3
MGFRPHAQPRRGIFFWTQEFEMKQSKSTHFYAVRSNESYQCWSEIVLRGIGWGILSSTLIALYALSWLPYIIG